MKNAKQFIDNLKHNKVFKRVLSVVLSLTMLIGIAQIIAVALPEPKADLPQMTFQPTNFTASVYVKSGVFGDPLDETVSFGSFLGSVNIIKDDDGNIIGAEAKANDSFKPSTSNGNVFDGNFDGEYAPKFVCWTKGDSLDDIYSYSPAIEPSEAGDYYAWFATEIHYVGQQWSSYAGSNIRNYVSSDYNIVEASGRAEASGSKTVTAKSSGAAVYGWDRETFDNCWYSPTIILEPTLLDKALQGSPDYELVEFPVTLFDYDAEKFNAAHVHQSGASSETIGFWNSGSGNGAYSNFGNSYNGGQQAAAQGILEPELDAKTGLPIPNTAFGGVDTNLFDPVNDVAGGKTVYSDVSFQFIKNKDTGWYEYNSALSHAQYDDASKSVKLYYENLAASESDPAGFFPFDDINSATVNGSGDFVYSHRTFAEWEKAYSNHVSGYTGTYVKTNPNFHNGMVMDFDFYLPENGTVDGTADGEAIQFEFNGDDDMWVFIDGNLVLDIGGGHGAILGDINFKDGTYSVASTVTKDDKTPVERGGNINLTEDTYHNIKIFYLERFAGQSNCRISFNLPAVPQRSITVEKDITDPDGNSVTTNDTFIFQLKTAAERAGAYIPVADKTYDVVDAKNPTNVISSDVPVGEYGTFTLQVGQKAIFEDFNSTDFYMVTEVIPQEMQGRYSKVKIDIDNPLQNPDGNYTSIPRQVTNKGSSTVFTNILTDPLAGADLIKSAEDIGNGQFKISLSITGATPNSNITVTDNVSKYFDIVSTVPTVTPVGQAVTFTGTTDSNGSWTGEIIIKPKADFWGGNAVPTNDGEAIADSEAKISHSFGIDSPKVDVPINAPNLESVNKTIYLGEAIPTFNELFPNNSKFISIPKVGDDDYWKVEFVNVSDITYSPDVVSGSEKGTYTASVTVTPKESGHVLSKNITAAATVTVKTCTLTITKSGGDANGNYIFKLSGTGNDLAEGINTVVSIGKDGSVTIKGLPIGSYTVTEDGNWSWRYSAENAAAILSPEQDTAYVTVTNSKANDKWLDAEDAVLNDFE